MSAFTPEQEARLRQIVGEVVLAHESLAECRERARNVPFAAERAQRNLEIAESLFSLAIGEEAPAHSPDRGPRPAPSAPTAEQAGEGGNA